MDSINYSLMGAVFGTQRSSLHNGSGIRTIMFLESCPLSCQRCSSPEFQSVKPVIMYKENGCLYCDHCITACKGGAISPGNKTWINRKLRSRCGEYVNTCPAGALVLKGKTISIQQITRGLRKNATTYRRSSGGIILSGGEPLIRYEFASELLQACKGQGWSTAVETTRVRSREVIEKVIPYVDTVLLDVRHMDGEQHKRLMGISSDLVIRNAPEICKISSTIVRVPVILGFNYSVEDIKAIAEFAGTLVGIRAIHLLPHHSFGENRYGLLGQDYTLRQIKPLAPEDLEGCKAVVESYGFRCIIGGQVGFQNRGRKTDQQLIEKAMKQVSDELGIGREGYKAETPKEECCNNIGLAEFVGVAIDDTIDLVIANADPTLVDVTELGEHRSVGIVGGRTGAGPQAWAVDGAVKATNTKIISMELPGNMKGGVGYDSLIYIGAGDVSDVRRAVEIAPQVLLKHFDDVCGDDAGHLEFQYTIRTGYCLEKALSAPVERASDMTYAGPAVIGAALTDIAVKATSVKVVGYCSPGNGGTSYSGGVILTFTGDPGTVCQAVKASIEAGKGVLGALGDESKSTTAPYT